MLNLQSPIPLYHQLADILMEGIRSGDYPSDSRIPSEPQLVFSLAGTSSAFHKKGIAVDVQLLQKTKRVKVGDDAENPFAGGTAFLLSRLNRVDGSPVLLEEIYLHPVLFKGIELMDLAGRSLSQVVESSFYMRPVGGRQTFRIGYLDPKEAALMDVNANTPVLVVHRFLNFKQADNAVFSVLYCKTESFVFSQQIGGLNHD
ncbi:MAG: GntR family transcriptional regulator [Desulfosarcina sp.]|nr:GntR family transcriptional regulator [Desulfosarcina sp.]MBC2764666.1 GntR family transcriptional regulator [Desulfosarcina sp.]